VSLPGAVVVTETILGPSPNLAVMPAGVGDTVPHCGGIATTNTSRTKACSNITIVQHLHIVDLGGATSMRAKFHLRGVLQNNIPPG